MLKVKKDDAQLTPEELERKQKSRFRILALLVIIDILLVVYLVVEIVIMFNRNNSKPSTSSSEVQNLINLKDIFSGLL